MRVSGLEEHCLAATLFSQPLGQLAGQRSFAAAWRALKHPEDSVLIPARLPGGPVEGLDFPLASREKARLVAVVIVEDVRRELVVEGHGFGF